MNLRFLHLNIEGRKHIDKISNFLCKNEFDVLCLQEVCIDTANIFKSKLGFAYQAFASMGFWSNDGSERSISIMSKYPITLTGKTLLTKPDANYIRLGKIDIEFYLLEATVSREGKEYCFATTHLPLYFNENGGKDGWKVSDFQIKCLNDLKSELQKRDNFLLTGDFNAPRGTVIFDELAKAYTDNVPKEVKTTIDPILHRAGGLQLVVDGVFTTKGYSLSDAQVLEGLSDHKGISGTLSVN